jgi:phosphoglycerate kinase
VQPAVSGFLMQKELEALGHALTKAEKPYVAIVGGAKVSDKIELIENFLNLATHILIGGAMAYTFFVRRKSGRGSR